MVPKRHFEPYMHHHAPLMGRILSQGSVGYGLMLPFALADVWCSRGRDRQLWLATIIAGTYPLCYACLGPLLGALACWPAPLA
jgi:hypothetical protein